MAAFWLAIAVHATTAIAASPPAWLVWFAKCEFEANRYLSCRLAAPALEAYLKSQSSVHPGVALTAFLKTHMEKNGCDYRVEGEAFRINGVFYSLDSRAFEQISCPGKGSKLTFAPDKATVFDLLEFWFDLPPN